MAAPPFKVKATFDYASGHDDDLAFSIGQIITVTDEEDAGWYYGDYADAGGAKQEGLFPKGFVERYEPETPPRPSRTNRQKKDVEASDTPRAIEATHKATAGSTEEEFAHEHHVNEESVALPPPKAEESSVTPRMPEPEPKAIPQQAEAPKPAAKPKPPPPSASKPSSAQTADAVGGGGSFRDRIAAFNKPAAPVAPAKPGGFSPSGSSFIKKPFVAPPPSRNAYVPSAREPPLQKVYRREEDPDVLAQASQETEPIERPTVSLPAASEGDGESQTKPTSLKDRIALLQKQQMEQAARHAEAGQKKEKPKRPPKKRSESHQHENEDIENLDGGDSARQPAGEVPRDETKRLSRSSTHNERSTEANPITSPTGVPREFVSDANDADQSGAADTEDGDETSTKDDSDVKPSRKSTIPLQRSPQPAFNESAARDEEDEAGDEDEDEEDEEEEIDPEVKRKMELRERMAKMSGGMGMAGMFGSAPAISATSQKKARSSVSSDKKMAESTSESTSTRAPPIPMVPRPGVQHVRSPEEQNKQLDVQKETVGESLSVVQGHEPQEMPDVEDVKEEPAPIPKNIEERTGHPPLPQDRPVPAPPPIARGIPPPVPSDRPAPPPPQSRPLPPPPAISMSPLRDLESDDEVPVAPSLPALDTNANQDPEPMGRGLPLATASGASPAIPTRPRAPAPQMDTGSHSSPIAPEPTTSRANRSSRVPPIPGSSPGGTFAPQMRAPPPPPPTEPSISRKSTDMSSHHVTPKQLAKEEEELTEYDGDYDTDIASGAPHKDALKSHARDSSLDESMTKEEAAFHHSGLPSIGPPPVSTNSAPRNVPPPPPSQPPKPSRTSSDMPRAAPPPPPPTTDPVYGEGNDDDEYDPYRYTSPPKKRATIHDTSDVDDDDDLYGASLPQQAKNFNSAAAVSPPTRLPPRQSLDVHRSNTNSRKSMDTSRASTEQGFIASDVDLGLNSQWWKNRGLPPPVFQNRKDLSFEVEESSRRNDGIVTKNVYLLFMDYSQTIVTAQYNATDPSQADLQQRHEAPPARLRQDQLEDAHTTFGTRIGDAVSSKQNNTVGDGTSYSLVMELLRPLSDALPPVGVRAFGAMVYANMANASVQQFDEIRSGDIVTFRNTKFQGHRGPMHQKYATEVGKPDHVGVVVDWDGTKKKVRAWEQGRESRKIKMESFKLGDLRSGEVKVWRVMGRSWVGWGKMQS
ncbi:hypothetical protein MMC09_000792 [Bachmanniomyces sp. S44760]|nr:hypothetical protein [Bachmanniomyces sp. S44760]